jgi:uncharacterized protein YjbI with pentapeptide repeats
MLFAQRKPCQELIKRIRYEEKSKENRYMKRPLRMSQIIFHPSMLAVLSGLIGATIGFLINLVSGGNTTQVVWVALTLAILTSLGISAWQAFMQERSSEQYTIMMQELIFQTYYLTVLADNPEISRMAQQRLGQVLKSLSNEQQISMLKFFSSNGFPAQFVGDALKGSKALSGADLRGIVLPQIQLQGADLSGINFSNANLTGAHLEEAWMINANLSGADLRQSYLIKTSLFGADLRQANLSKAHMHQAGLIKAKLSGAVFHKSDLTGALLEGANLKQADLTGADLTGALLKEADLTGATLINANLSGAYLKGADLKQADLTGAILDQTYLDGADIRGAKVTQEQLAMGLSSPTS